MTQRRAFVGGAAFALLAALLASLALGAITFSPGQVAAALFAFDEGSYDHAVIAYQRLPRALIAIHVGAVMACGGAVLQGLLRNPLASPSLLGINAGATLFVVAGVAFLDIGQGWQGMAAVSGGLVGFLSCILVARMVGLSRDPRGLALILSGAVVSMLYVGLANALLLADPFRRADLLSWVTGNINHVYAGRLEDFWGLGAIGLVVLLALARPLTLIAIGAEKAASGGVNVVLVSRVAIVAVALSASAAVAICGPVGFVGLVVPHIVRPFTGAALGAMLPGCALAGATTCLLADLIARLAFAPYVLHTGVMMDLLGGIVFALIVKRFYLTPGAWRGA